MNLIYKEFSKPVPKLKHFILNMNGKPGKGNWGNVSDLHMQLRTWILIRSACSLWMTGQTFS